MWPTQNYTLAGMSPPLRIVGLEDTNDLEWRRDLLGSVRITWSFLKVQGRSPGLIILPGYDDKVIVWHVYDTFPKLAIPSSGWDMTSCG
jgi:hypothetical protein